MAYTNEFNNSKYLLLILFFSTVYINSVICIDPITIGAAVGVGALGFGFFKGQTYCRLYECCDQRSVPADISKLSQSFENTLFGQHLVKQTVIPALSAHMRPDSLSRKPLVMSFHGTPGTGKSFVSDLIAQALFQEGAKSKFVHKYMGRADFSHPLKVEEYKERINREVRESIQNCPLSLFIFDEVDKMPVGVFDTLTSLIDYAANVKDADYTKAVFIFLSNSAGVKISNYLAELMQKGIRREDTRLSDFEVMLKKAAYNTEGGLKLTHMIDAHVIDHYVPFLALEKAHVAQCVEAEFRRWLTQPTQNMINEVIKSAVTFDPNHSMFATSGCKMIEKKVAIVANHKSTYLTV